MLSALMCELTPVADEPVYGPGEGLIILYFFSHFQESPVCR